MLKLRTSRAKTEKENNPKVIPKGPRDGKRIDNGKRKTTWEEAAETHNAERWPETDEFASLPLELKWKVQVKRTETATQHKKASSEIQ